MNIKYKLKDKLFKTNKKTKLLVGATLMWMGVIFWFSAQPADESAQLSGNLAAVLEGIVVRVFSGYPEEFRENVLLKLPFIVRKTAHVIEYLILGVLVCTSAVRLKFKRSFMLSVVFCMLYAASDEFHQMFVPGRGPAISDVLLDTVAAAIGAVVQKVWGHTR